jgi:hypothetical protein
LGSRPNGTSLREGEQTASKKEEHFSEAKSQKIIIADENYLPPTNRSASVSGAGA